MIYRTLRSEFDSIEGFENFINSMQDQTDDMTIYLSGEFQEYHWCFKFQDFINRYCGEVTIVAPADSNYAAGILFVTANSKKVVVPTSTMRFGKPWWILNSGNSREQRAENEKSNMQGKYATEYVDGVLKQILTKEEYAVYESGEFVSLYYDRCKEVAALAEKLFYKPKEKKSEC